MNDSNTPADSRFEEAVRNMKRELEDSNTAADSKFEEDSYFTDHPQAVFLYAGRPAFILFLRKSNSSTAAMAITPTEKLFQVIDYELTGWLYKKARITLRSKDGATEVHNVPMCWLGQASADAAGSFLAWIKQHSLTFQRIRLPDFMFTNEFHVRDFLIDGFSRVPLTTPIQALLEG